MSKKSSKLVEISEMFDKIEVDFEKLNNKFIIMSTQIFIKTKFSC